MIDRQHNQNVLICDNCDIDYEPYPRDEFTAMVAAAKSDGWEIRPDGEGHYMHRCTSCSGSNESALQRARSLFG